MEKLEKRQLMRDISRGALGSVGLSIYILADSFFVSKKLGVLGVSVMNLTMPLFNLMEGLGLLLGMGGATLFVIDKIQEPSNSKKVFPQIFRVGLGLGIFFMILGLTCPRAIAGLLGANASIIGMTTEYTHIILIGGPVFVLNNFFLSFVRNDRDTLLAMIAMLASSIWNVVADWLFILVFGWGMLGAGLATSSAPLVSILIMSVHWFNGKNTLSFKPSGFRMSNLKYTLSLGLPSFLMEMSNGVTIFIFNRIILTVSNEYAVAAYGVITNVLLVALALFTGTAQGIQPFVSKEFARRGFKKAFKALHMAIRVALGIALLVYVVSVVFRGPIVEAFNEQHNAYVAALATKGLPILLFSLFFSAINNQLIIFLSSADATKQSIGLVLFRGYLLVWPVLLPLAFTLKMDGVWLGMPIIEAISLVAGLILIRRIREVIKTKYGDKKRGLEDLEDR